MIRTKLFKMCDYVSTVGNESNRTLTFAIFDEQNMYIYMSKKLV